MFRILVIGYYYRKNFGDDLFEYIFKNHIFNAVEYDVTIVNIDDFDKIINQLQENALPPFDIVIFGGGDIINTYFFSKENIDRIRKVFSSKSTKIIFYGVGISFLSTLHLLDIGDYFYMRNKPDYEIVKYKYGKPFSFYTPDLVYKIQFSPLEDSNEIQNIGICFPYTWFAYNVMESNSFFTQLCTIITNLSKTYKIHMLPFDTSQNNKNSDLILLQHFKKVINEYNEIGEQCVFYYEDTLDLNQMLQFYNKLDLMIGGRYHSIVMSIITKTPFIALHSTRKVENIQYELPSELSQLFLPLEVNDNFVPTQINTASFYDKLDYVINNNGTIKNKLQVANSNLSQQMNQMSSHLKTLITTNAKTRSGPPCYMSEEEKRSIIEQVLSKVEASLPKNGCLRTNYKTKVRKLLQNGSSINSCFINRRKADFSVMCKTLTEEILWIITGDPYGPYYYGLRENVVTQPLLPQINWIIDDYYSRFKYKANTNVLVINKNFQELHRSGWQYIVNNIVLQLNDNINDTNGRLYIDTYVDKTFHWNKDFYASKGIIPYNSPWIGFIHHTFSNYNNKFNCTTLFQSPTFIQSLETCKCLIVMSHALKRQIDTKLDSMTNLQNKPQVRVIYHPSEQTSKKFAWDKFALQQSRPVVQIGNWLRNMFSIYTLSIPKNSLITEKAILKNKNSENYFLPPWFFDKLEQVIGSSSAENPNLDMCRLIPADMCRLNIENMHLKGMYDHLVSSENSVTVIEHLNNEEYDNLLASSIVFIHLIDASAVNTVIECILRNTPILVNPIDAVVEVLGNDYPLYYTSIYEASKLLENFDVLQSAYNYLQTMDKSKFLISTFTSDFTNILSEIL
jgi:hypothetical protein